MHNSSLKIGTHYVMRTNFSLWFALRNAYQEGGGSKLEKKRGGSILCIFDVLSSKMKIIFADF